MVFYFLVLLDRWIRLLAWGRGLEDVRFYCRLNKRRMKRTEKGERGRREEGGVRIEDVEVGLLKCYGLKD